MEAVKQLLAKDDQTLAALGVILSAWEEGTDSGIPAEIMAYAALFTALTDLVTVFGEDAVAELVFGLRDRVRGGEFTLSATLQ